jgi:hypothetical protein
MLRTFVDQFVLGQFYIILHWDGPQFVPLIHQVISSVPICGQEKHTNADSVLSK